MDGSQVWIAFRWNQQVFFFQPDEINWGQDMRRAQKQEKAGNNDQKRQKRFFSDIDLGEEELYKIKKGMKVLPKWYLASRKRCRLSWFNMFSQFQYLLKSAKHCLRIIMQGKPVASTVARSSTTWCRHYCGTHLWTQWAAAVAAKTFRVAEMGFWPETVSKYPHSMQGVMLERCTEIHPIRLQYCLPPEYSVCLCSKCKGEVWMYQEWDAVIWLFVQENLRAVSSVHNKQGAKHVEVWMIEETKLTGYARS